MFHFLNIFDFIYLAKFANNTFEGKEYYMRNKMHIFPKILLGLLVGIIIFLLMFILYVKFGISKEIDLSLLKTGQTTVTKIYAFDRENGEIRLDLPIELSEERIFLQNSEWCSIAGIPENLKNAFIAVEDHKFYEHKGVNWQRTIRAGLNYIANFGKSEFGGSTITQQLVKNLTGDDMVTPKRKLEEIFRAQNLEKKLTKDEILELYLNVVYLSQNCYGIQSASQIYFGKDVSELTLAECASIASIVKSPIKYDPYKYPENNISRRKIVLQAMLEQGMISKNQYKDALVEKLQINSNIENESKSGVYSWFTEKLISDIKADLMNKYKLTDEGAMAIINRGGLKIYSTIDLQAQNAVDEVFKNYIAYLKPQNGKYPEASCVILDPNTADVLAIAGGVGVKSANRIFNRATDAKRPLGSVIKPLSVYAPAIEKGVLTYASAYDDVPILKNGRLWPRNASNTYRGLVSVNYAIEHSLNTVAVKALNDLGLDSSFDFCRNKLQLNLVDEDRNEAPLALGQLTEGDTLLNATRAYTAFSSGGILSKARSYYYVTDANDNVILNNDYEGERIISADCASVMSIMLQNVAQNGTAKSLTIKNDYKIATKTGTSGENKDKWIIGYTPYYACGVWVGYDTPTSMNYSGAFATSMFDAVMKNAHLGKDKNAELFDSGNLVKSNFCVDSGDLPNDSCQLDPRLNRIQVGYFIKGTEPREHCELHKEIFINSQTGKIAPQGLHSIFKRKIALIDYNRASEFDEIEVFDKDYLISSRK